MNEYSDFVTPFRQPAPHYGEVPFYWWNGEKLNRERLTAQLESLAANGVAGVQVNYAHQYGGGEKDLPYGGAGRSIPGDPAQFSEDWWDFFGYAAHECERLGMGIGVGDYTIAWIGNGFFTDQVAKTPGMGAMLLSAQRKMLFCREDLGDAADVLAAVTYEDADCCVPRVLYARGSTEDFPYGCYEAYILRFTPAPLAIDPMAPGCGELLTHIYFEEFERRLPDLKPGTLNYFFQDELLFGADARRMWREELRERVQAEKGYDPLGFLPHLFYNLGPMTAKIRLDIADCRTALMEEHYFRPVFDFHNSRGMIYGCDQSSRGRDPGEFSDYFRAVRWFTAPGNDTPGRAADLVKVKVNASIAHLYGRPRVWLEGYHSSGWGTALSSITAPTSDNFLFGANLLNLHGLYYSTFGGFFEWAPPDFHFRMPYWDDAKTWLDRYKRLSAVLTAGVHICDAAVFYPVSSCDYGENAEHCCARTFQTAAFLFSRGLDFDFIDHQSILRAEIENGKLCVAGGAYQLVVLCAVDCIRFPVLEKLRDFALAGGNVVFLERTPYETDLTPVEKPRLRAATEEILCAPGGALVDADAELLQFVNRNVRRMFLPDADDLGEQLWCAARDCGGQRLFFLRHCAKNSVCRFEAAGQPFLLRPEEGKIYRLLGTVQAAGFTFIKLPLEADEDTLILFSDDYVPFDGEWNTAGFREEKPVYMLPLEGDWDFSLRPTLDNTYGDFYQPPGGMIGAEARFFRCWQENDPDAAQERPFCQSEPITSVPVTGNVFAVARRLSKAGMLPLDPSAPQPFHDRYGYIHPAQHDPAAQYEQGWHGLKGRVYDYNMTFDTDCVFITDIVCAAPTHAWLYLTGVKPDVLYVNGQKIDDFGDMLLLPAGRARLAAGFVYDETRQPDFVNRASLKRAGVWLTTEKNLPPETRPLCIRPFANPVFLPMENVALTTHTFAFSFRAVPGTYGFEGCFFGRLLHAELNGRPMTLEETGTGFFGGTCYRAEGEKSDTIPEITFMLETDPGRAYTGAIPEPVKLLHGTGVLPCGNALRFGALKNYSGKLVYQKTVAVPETREPLRWELDLGEVSVSARVAVNGRLAAVLPCPPYRCDVTDFLSPGENEIEVTVSNTLANHYSTVPSGYSNFPADAASGLIGPVALRAFGMPEEAVVL